MGLPESNPEKEGVLVSVDNLVNEMRSRLTRKARVDGMVTDGAGLRVVGGIRGEADKAEEKEIPLGNPKAEPVAVANVEETTEAGDAKAADS